MLIYKQAWIIMAEYLHKWCTQALIMRDIFTNRSLYWYIKAVFNCDGYFHKSCCYSTFTPLGLKNRTLCYEMECYLCVCVRICVLNLYFALTLSLRRRNIFYFGTLLLILCMRTGRCVCVCMCVVLVVRIGVCL